MERHFKGVKKLAVSTCVYESICSCVSVYTYMHTWVWVWVFLYVCLSVCAHQGSVKTHGKFSNRSLWEQDPFELFQPSLYQNLQSISSPAIGNGALKIDMSCQPKTYSPLGTWIFPPEGIREMSNHWRLPFQPQLDLTWDKIHVSWKHLII